MEKTYSDKEVDLLLNHILNDVLCKGIGKEILQPIPNSNKIAEFVSEWFKEKPKYLPLSEVTNMYSQFGQFGQLSPEDKAFVNKKMEIKMQIKKLKRLLK